MLPQHLYFKPVGQFALRESLTKLFEKDVMASISLPNISASFTFGQIAGLQFPAMLMDRFSMWLVLTGEQREYPILGEAVGGDFSHSLTTAVVILGAPDKIKPSSPRTLSEDKKSPLANTLRTGYVLEK